MAEDQPQLRSVTYVPLELAASFPLPKRRWTLSPGLWLERLTGSLKRQLDSDMARVITPRVNVNANYAVGVSSREYGDYIRKRLADSGKPVLSSPDDFDHVAHDALNVAQMLITAMLLRREIRFAIGGAYGFDLLPDGRRDIHRTTLDTRSLDAMTYMWRQYHPNRSKGPLSRRLLSQTIRSIECYYRPLTWEIDRLAMALKHFWDAFTTHRFHQNFISLTVALECLLTTRDIEVTHLIAERAACLIGKGGAHRLHVYDTLRGIYAARSKIVHGRGVPQRIDLKSTLVVSPKINVVPEDVHRRLIALSIELFNALLPNKEYLEIIRSGAREDIIDKHLDAFFIKLLLQR
jgi:hypothetical protein